MISRLFRPIRLGTIFAIPIRISPVVVALVLLILWDFAGRTNLHATGQLAVLLLILAASLLVHEMSHALVGRRLGLRVHDITIWPLGGMARMDGLAEQPELEAPVAAAGPLANLIVAVICWVLPGSYADSGLAINLVLGLGNLLPAFPLDGGRILRSWLVRHAPPAAATRAAVTVSNAILWVLLLIGAWLGSFWIMALLCAFLYWAGRMELMQAMLRTGNLPVLEPGEVISRALKGSADPDSLD